MEQIQRAIKGNEWDMYRGQKCAIDKDIVVWLIDTQLNTMGIQWEYSGHTMGNIPSSGQVGCNREDSNEVALVFKPCGSGTYLQGPL